MGTPRARIQSLTTNLEHVKRDGESSADFVVRIENILEMHKKSINRYAFIIHDKDVYDLNDEKKDSTHKAGTLKSPHIHIVLELKNALELTLVAKWFNIPPHLIEIKKGRNAFLECVRYLTHEDVKQQELGKILYADKCVYANFDFREAINDLYNFGKQLTDKERMLHDILYNGKTLKQCRVENPYVFMMNIDLYKKRRNDYIATCVPPNSRINIYVTGNGGVGKGCCSKALARAIVKKLRPDLVENEDMYFEAGAPGVAFQGYDGQPVIIWNDRRSYDLFKELGNRSNVFNVFETTPTNQKQNIKYGDTSLINCINIINSVESIDSFIKGLAGEYTDKDGNFHQAEDINQVKRRVPVLIELGAESFEILFNSGYFNKSDDYGNYEEIHNIKGNFGVVRKKLEPSKACIIEEKMVQMIVDKILPILSGEIEYENDMEFFADYGTIGDGFVSEPSKIFP